MEYKIIRHHKRKRLLITVHPTGEVVVKAPLFASDKFIDDFVQSKSKWINEIQMRYQQKFHHRITVTKEEREQLKKQALPLMKELVDRYAPIMQVEPKSVKITVAEKRWGSCSGRNTICFSYKTALISPKCREYLVIHELSHLREMNHSKRFYNTVAQYMPDYKEAEKELEGYFIRAIQ